MSKFLALIFGTVLLCAAITACGDKDKSEADKNTGNTENIAETEYGDYNYYAGNDSMLYDSRNDDSRNGIEEIITDAGDAVNGIVSEGERIVDDVVEDMTDSTETTTTDR